MLRKDLEISICYMHRGFFMKVVFMWYQFDHHIRAYMFINGLRDLNLLHYNQTANCNKRLLERIFPNIFAVRVTQQRRSSISLEDASRQSIALCRILISFLALLPSIQNTPFIQQALYSLKVYYRNIIWTLQMATLIFFYTCFRISYA